MRTRTLSLVLVGGLALAACGGDDDADDGPQIQPSDETATDTTEVETSETVEGAGVTRNADGTLTIAWTGATDAEVQWGTDPDDTATALAPSAGATSVTVPDPKPGARVFFEIVPAGADAGVVVAERLLPLEGQPNFRDLGGYETADGRTVKWGTLYRAGELGNLTDADLAYMESTGIKVVCDFRSDGEVELLADRLPPGVETVRLPIANDAIDGAKIREQVIAGDLSGLTPELLVTANQSFVTDFGAEYSAMMQRVMDPAARPALVHCTAGKDRAGFAAAIVLLALGVPEATVMDDYLLTNTYRADTNEETIAAAGAIVADPEPLRPVLEARSEYLQAALDTMVAEYGSVDGYLRDGLGITDEQRAAFQDAMLQ